MFLLKKITVLFTLFFIMLIGVNLFAQETTNISEDEIKQYAQVYKDMMTVQQGTQQEMVQAIQAEGLELQTFTAIQQAQQNPEAETNFEEKDLEKFNAVNMELEKIQITAQEKMIGKIEDNGMTVQRYQELSAIVQSNPEIQEKIQAHLN